MQKERKRLLGAATLFAAGLFFITTALAGEYDAYISWGEAQKKIRKCEEKEKTLEEEQTKLKRHKEMLEKSMAYDLKKIDRLHNQKELAKKELEKARKAWAKANFRNSRLEKKYHEAWDESGQLSKDWVYAKQTYHMEENEFDELITKSRTLDKDLVEVREKCKRLKNWAKLGEDKTREKAMEALTNGQFQCAEFVIKQLQPGEGKIIIEEMFAEKAINDCKFATAERMISQLTSGAKGRDELKRQLAEARKRQEVVRRQYFEARKKWKEAKNHNNAGKYDDALILWRESLRLLRKANETACLKYREKIKIAIDGMELCQNCRKRIQTCRAWAKNYAYQKARIDKARAKDPDAGVKDAADRMLTYKYHYDTNCCRECLGSLD